ncbi:LysE family translocator [Thermoactinomyces mirandus]|uniref:LysE family transporter n=1 Tax=Thermoactinomyces mirandus TaxID=2756294 RepID=A0A7W2ASF0_9BACL|nr:LysE family transporter [Thermoactinomyces mirandus]MBA4603352.1 LysE family transporter [Thermoactinomyces mirandus]
METWLGYFLLGFALSTPICPVNIEMIRQGAANGFFYSWLVGLGDVISNLLMIGIIFYGFSNWFSNPEYLSVIAITSGCYLIYLGMTNLKADLSISQLIGPFILLGKGFVLGLTNPIDFLSWLGVYSTIQHLPLSFFITAVLYLLIGCGMWNLVLSLSVSWCRRYLKPEFIRKFHVVSGLILCAYGIFFAWYGLKLLFE